MKRFRTVLICFVFTSLAAALAAIGQAVAADKPAGTVARSGTVATSGTTHITTPVAMLVEIDGPIGPAVSSHIVNAIKQAEQAQAAALILRMDTPGGLVSAMRDIVKAILNSEVPVISYVSPSGARAASAGTYILYASHVAAMAPATNLGAATPIPVASPMPSLPKPESGSKGDQGDNVAPAGSAAEIKVLNDAVAYIRGLAERRGRNADWAEQAVRGGVSLTAEKALAENVIDVMAADIDSLLKIVDGRVVQLVTNSQTLHTAQARLQLIEPNWRTELLAILTTPSVAYILMMIGIYGLLLEGYNPGGVVPGVVGAICLLLALFAFQILPVNYAGLALIALGLGLMMAEFFVPSFGILGIGGISAFVFGSIMLMDTGVPGYEVPVAMIAATATASALLIAATVYLLLRARRRGVVTGGEALLGAKALANDNFSADEYGFSGHVRVAGEVWSARSQQAIHEGQKLIVTRREGLTVNVEPDPGQGDTT